MSDEHGLGHGWTMGMATARRGAGLGRITTPGREVPPRGGTVLRAGLELASSQGGTGTSQFSGRGMALSLS